MLTRIWQKIKGKRAMNYRFYFDHESNVRQSDVTVEEALRQLEHAVEVNREESTRDSADTPSPRVENRTPSLRPAILER